MTKEKAIDLVLALTACLRLAYVLTVPTVSGINTSAAVQVIGTPVATHPVITTVSLDRV